MAFNFRQTAQDSVVLCKLMSGRTKLGTFEVTGKVLTVNAFDFAPKYDRETNKPIIDPETGEPDTYGVITFVEFPDRYYCVGTVFTKVCKAWESGFTGDPEKNLTAAEVASAELSASGGVKVTFKESMTKTGNNLVNVVIL